MTKTNNTDNIEGICRQIANNPAATVAFCFHPGQSPEIRGRIATPTASSPLTFPISLSIAVFGRDRASSVIAAKIEITDHSAAEAIKPLFDGSGCYVGYHLSVDLCCLQALGIPRPRQLWDIRHAQRLLTLGQINSNARAKGESTQAAQIESKAHWKSVCEERLDFYAVASSYEVQCFGYSLVVNYLRVAAAQYRVLQDSTVLQCLEQIEMPWLAVLADMHYQGIRVDRERHAELLHVAGRIMRQVARELQTLGIDKPHSHKDLQAYFNRSGELWRFQIAPGQFSFDDDILEQLVETSPVVDLLRRFRKASNIYAIQRDVRDLLGTGERIHPAHTALGTETGRQTCYDPNLLGYCRIQRNTAIANSGYAIAGIDFAQQELGIAAGMYRDPQLIAMYNQGDAYTQMARRFYAGRPEIEAGSESWTNERFRQKYGELRSRMKVVTLAILYGQGAYGLAQRLNITEAQGRVYLKRFFELFPVLAEGQRQVVELALRDGYVELINGMRIAIDQYPGISTSARTRYARNYPIQGSGAIILKAVGNKLSQIYPRYRAQILVPMHDEIVFQAPKKYIADVIAATSEVMISTMKRYFPELTPRVDVNAATPGRWVKDGCEQALELYLQS